MNKDKPFLFLDVDVVLNPNAAAACPEGYREYDFFPGEESVRLAEVHGQWLRELSETFDVVWASGWGADAHRLIAPVLRRPRFHAVEFPPVPFEPALKVQRISSFVDDR